MNIVTFETAQSISDGQIIAIRELQKIWPEKLIFSGSLSLNHFGIVNRKCADIDILSSCMGAAFESIPKADLSEKNSFDVYESKSDGGDIIQFGFRFMDERFCVFRFENDRIEPIKIGEGEYLVADPIGAINAKIGYIKNARNANNLCFDSVRQDRAIKHLKDCIAYYRIWKSANKQLLQ